MNDLLVVLPYADSDAAQMFSLLGWMKELGGCKGHSCLLVSAYQVDAITRLAMRTAAGFVFQDVFAIDPGKTYPDETWPRGANILFHTAMQWVQRNTDSAFLWNEGDCHPLKPDWLQIIECEYAACGKDYMGVILKETTVFGRTYFRHLPGNAIYVNDTASRLAHLDLLNAKEAFDLLAGGVIAPHAHESRRFCHIWGTVEASPHFVEARKKGDPPHFLTLDQIPRDACLFHRVKSSSLTDLLRQRNAARALCPA